VKHGGLIGVVGTSVGAFGVIGGGGSDDMFFNSLVIMVGVVCVPFFQMYHLGKLSQGERGFWRLQLEE
jgi:hypothetical protein